MSRVNFESSGEMWTVGYDKAIATYFAQVEVEGADDILDVAGTSLGELPTLDSLAEALKDRVALPDDVLRQLSADPSVTAVEIEAAQGRLDDIMDAFKTAHHGNSKPAEFATSTQPISRPAGAPAEAPSQHLELGR